MFNTKTLKKTTRCASIVVILWGAGATAYAHTGVRDQADEGKSSYNAFTIGHGCSSSGEGEPPAQAYPVLGQTALFPYGDTAVWRDGAGAVIQQGGNGNGTINGEKLSLGVSGFASMLSPFKAAQEIVDGNGIVRALHWRDGAVEPKLAALTPFKINAPTIANPCVKSLKIRVGVINWCDIKQNQATDAKGPYRKPKDAFGRPIPLVANPNVNNNMQTNVADSPVFKELPGGNGDNNRADWWFSSLYGGSALYNDPELVGADDHSWSATIIVNNTSADIAACGGTPVDYTVEPAGIDFDTYLTAPNTQPFTKGSGPF